MRLFRIVLLISAAAIGSACGNNGDHPVGQAYDFDTSGLGGSGPEGGAGSSGRAGGDGAAGSQGQSDGGDALDDGAFDDANPPSDAPGGKGGPVIGDREAGTVLVCGVSQRAFDLSQMAVASAVPQAFANAWKAEQMAILQGPPGLGLGLRNLDVGPVRATVGAVYAVSQVNYAFVGVPSSESGLAATVGAAPRSITVGPIDTHFVVSFTSNMMAHGFSVSAIGAEVTLSAQCDAATGQIDLTVPATNVDQPFGGSTVGDALGSPTVDTDHDGMNDAWTVSLTGTAPAFAWSGK